MSARTSPRAVHTNGDWAPSNLPRKGHDLRSAPPEGPDKHEATCLLEESEPLEISLSPTRGFEDLPQGPKGKRIPTVVIMEDHPTAIRVTIDPLTSLGHPILSVAEAGCTSRRNASFAGKAPALA